MIELLTINDLSKLDKKGLNQVLPQATVISRIYSFLEDLNVEPIKHLPIEADLGQGRSTNLFHASSIGSATGKSLCGRYAIGCGRSLYYDLVGEASEGAWEPRMRSLLDTGSVVHAQLQAYLREVAARSNGTETFEPEAVIDPSKNPIADMMDISGHTDGMYTIRIPDLSFRFGIELKTINDAGYHKTSGPHTEHITQGTIYQKCLDLPVMLFVYYNKNDSRMVEYPHVFDEALWSAISAKLYYVRSHALAGTPPERENGWYCSSCKYRQVCQPPKRSKGPDARVTSMFRKKKEN